MSYSFDFPQFFSARDDVAGGFSDLGRNPDEKSEEETPFELPAEPQKLPSSDEFQMESAPALLPDIFAAAIEDAKGAEEATSGAAMPPGDKPPGDNVTGHASGAPDEGSGLPSAAELEQTLQRLMRRVSMLVQAEKCVFLLHDRERSELVARPPALGFSREQLRALRLPLDAGVAAQAFRGGEAVVVEDVNAFSENDAAWARHLEARNLIAYPLVLERRDEQERVADKITVGVFLVLNKRGKSGFTPEDLRLLSVMARQVTAVIADAQIYLQLTEEKEQLAATLQSLGSGVLMIESTGHISQFNAAARALFGVPEGVGLGQPFDEVIHEPQIVELLNTTLQDGKEGRAEIEFELPATTSRASIRRKRLWCAAKKAAFQRFWVWPQFSPTSPKFATSSA